MTQQAGFRLLFVCTGNTCRSPLAQAIAEASVARRGWDAVEIRSAGVSAAPGGRASEGAIGAAQSGGLDLEGHRSTPLDAELVDWASLVLTMGSHHADRAEELGGEGKVWMLTAFSDGDQDVRGPGVPDPFGGDARDYLRCLEALDTMVEAALGRIEAEYLGSADSLGSPASLGSAESVGSAELSEDAS